MEVRSACFDFLLNLQDLLGFCLFSLHFSCLFWSKEQHPQYRRGLRWLDEVHLTVLLE